MIYLADSPNQGLSEYIPEPGVAVVPAVITFPLVIVGVILVALGVIYWTACNSPSFYLIGVAGLLFGGAVGSLGAVRSGAVLATVGVIIFVLGFFFFPSGHC